MLKLIKRIILFFIATFVSMNAAVFFILNSQTVQHAIVEYINVNYFNKQNLELSLGSLSLSFLTGTLNLNEVFIKENKIGQSKNNENLVSMNQLSVSFNMGSSYVLRSLVIKKVLFRGLTLNLKYDENGSFVLPKFISSVKKEKSSDDPLDIPNLLKEIMPKIPFDIEVINIVLQLGESNQRNFQRVSIAHAELTKIIDKNKMQAFHVKALINDSAFKFPSINNLISLNYLNTNITLYPTGVFFINSLELKSNLADLKASINGTIESKIEKTKYKAKFDYIDINGKDVFGLLDMESTGRAKLVGNVESGKTLFEDPTFEGNIQWNGMLLEDFDIYSGSAHIHYNSRKIEYSDAVIRTPLNGIIRSKGEFQFYKNFSFENFVSVENFTFAELLKGLRVSSTPVDFYLSSESLKISGDILSKNKMKSFELYAEGVAKAQKIYVNTFPDQIGRKPIPDININLDLSASSLGLTLTKTEGITKNTTSFNTGKLIIDYGYLDFTPKSGVGVNFKLIGKNIDISAAEYFLKFPTSGTADFTGELKLDEKTKEIEFSSQSKIYGGEIFGLKFNDFNGKWGLNSKGVWVKNALIILGESEKENKSTLHLNNFTFNFIDMNSIIEANINGELNNIVYAAQHWLPKKFQDANGNIQHLKVSQSGLFFHLSSWDLNLKSQIDKLKILDSEIQDSNIELNCKSGLCKNSIISFIDIATNDNDEKKNDENLSFAIFELNDLSFENSGIRARIFKLPLGIFSRFFDKKLTGVLNSNVQFKGKWNKIEGFANVNAYNVNMDESELGDLNLQILPYDNNKIKIDLKAFSNQFDLSYVTQQDLEGVASLEINLYNLNSFLFIKSETRSKNNLFSQVNGTFKFSGLSPFSKDLKQDWYRHWKGSGILSSGVFQVGKAIFELTHNHKIDFNGDELQMDSFALGGKIGKIQFGKSNLNFAKKTLLSSFIVDINIGKLDIVSDVFGPSEGDLNGKFSISGSIHDPEFVGSLYVGAKTLFVKSLQPAFTNMNGDFIFRGKRLEIQNFFTEKGEGNITASGSIDFSPVFSENPSYPEISIKVSAKKADLRLQIPIFQIADLNIDSDLVLSGSEVPYHLMGEISLKKLRLFKDINCQAISSQIFALNNTQVITRSKPFLNLNVDIHALSSITIQSQCIRGRFSTSPTINVSGDTVDPILSGMISTDNASLILLKSRFEIKKADFTFIELQKYDPNVDIQMEARILSHTVLANMNGRLTKSRLDLSASPATLANGDRITQGDIISMITTGQEPLQSSSANLLTASTSFFSFVGYGSFSDNSILNNTVSSVTGGIVDNITIAPTSQNGQVSWRATASRSLSQRLNLGVSYETGDIGTRSSAYASFIFNETVSIFGSYDNSALTQQTTTTEWSSGLRFRFGSQ
ncbi:translocation/assembly module TamB domain-containing protein [Fluviispira multicolorata]|uniref:Autotransporter translocation and assembly factor TamB n=1 Tax=Fluviispira multicolorata TaxID=2654512 RepID=A0A833JC82_9BACT|nr:hypothetical protein [Fluviispira multicolorata]KAB8030676.1 hypothetical protein GCL57_06790 [Fluviispira multicolorata]